MLLLMWTAVDIAAPGLCALEREDDFSIVADADKAATVVTTDASLPDDPSTPPLHVDDCFCCSHCVDLSRHVMMFSPAGDVECDAIVMLRLVDHIPPPPYHPPLS